MPQDENARLAAVMMCGFGFWLAQSGGFVAAGIGKEWDEGNLLFLAQTSDTRLPRLGLSLQQMAELTALLE